MLALLLSTLLLADTTAATAPPRTSAPDSAASPRTRRVVREFPAVQVRALVHDPRSSQTVHLIPSTVLRTFPVDGLADVLALQAGVVAHGEELHVRGGRTGETATYLDGLPLNEALLHRPIEVPLFALRSAELVSGAPDAQYGGGLAGALALRTIDPSERRELEWRWQTDGRTGTHYDRVTARASTPLLFGLGLVTAAEATLDDTWMPMLRSERRREIAGLSFGWRAENRLLGFAKLASLSDPERASAEVIVGRHIHRPWDPNFTVDGWMFVPANLKLSPIYSPTPQPGYHRYKAADHVASTDDRQIATLLRVATPRGPRRLSVGLGWVRTRTLTSVGGRKEDESASHRPRYGSALDRDRYDALWGDYPLYRERATDVLTLRADAERIANTGSVSAGGGLTYEDVAMREMDWQPWGTRAGDEGYPFPLDSIRKYQAHAPGGWTYVQGRWTSGGLVMNAGLRAEYWTPGRAAARQTLPGRNRGIWSIAPRLGFAYPMSVRDVFSLAYVRVHQAPARDYLYDQRVAISDRQPLGNPALEPATLISYETSVKHLFDAEWALQGSLFYRDVYGQVGARDAAVPQGPINMRYDDDDDGHVLGFETSLLHARGDRRRLEVRYVWMTTWGNESRPGGDPYGPVRSLRIPPIGSRPLAWDRRHSVHASGAWQWKERLTASWSTAVLSPLPWTPKPRREPVTDLSVVNSRRLDWIENTNLNVAWTPPRALGLTFGIEVRNLFDNRGAHIATVDGYPNPIVNTLFDDYGAHRTETGAGGGAFWSSLQGRWIPVNDPRLVNPPRAVRASIGASW